MYSLFFCFQVFLSLYLWAYSSLLLHHLNWIRSININLLAKVQDWNHLSRLPIRKTTCDQWRLILLELARLCSHHASHFLYLRGINLLFCIVSICPVYLRLNRGTPKDQGVAPLVADPALILDVLPCWVHLPLAGSRYFKLMAQPSLEFKLKSAISSLRRLKRLAPLHRPDKFLFALYLFEHQPIKSFVLPGCHSKQVLYDALTLYLEVSVLEWSAVYSLLQVAWGFLRDSGIPCEVNSHKTLWTPQCSTKLKDHHLVKAGVAQVQMDQMIVVLYYPQEVVQKVLCVVIKLLFFLSCCLAHVIRSSM